MLLLTFILAYINNSDCYAHKFSSIDTVRLNEEINNIAWPVADPSWTQVQDAAEVIYNNVNAIKDNDTTSTVDVTAGIKTQLESSTASENAIIDDPPENNTFDSPTSCIEQNVQTISLNKGYEIPEETNSSLILAEGPDNKKQILGKNFEFNLLLS